MAKLPTVTSTQLIVVLQKLGFKVIRQKGSHVRLKDQDNRVVTIPIHAGKTIGKGLLLKIIRDAEITKEELIRLLD
ncbi:type II toxin-antitoxin system HicA family toxin [Synechocystis sp. CACIAM 05]|uniref:type II toxin-antitoxin system HicA family toxin n=1 Tax=Synechocystis sp. CACIAM 05 TaxID=1933929 RepID=UPI00138E8DBF|nr:type II toxin-antitoxin system HicA family toxin [Synechocystis sp. CACIAM 05]QHV01456.1 hypothetical protein BWK47_15825 [Synechocystis sp. CACIAM 05]